MGQTKRAIGRRVGPYVKTAMAWLAVFGTIGLVAKSKGWWPFALALFIILTIAILYRSL